VEALCFKWLRQSPGVSSLLVPRCRDRLKEFVVNWFIRYVFGSHVSEWLALARVILLLLALGIALLKLVFWILTRERNADEREGKSEREYWRIHGR
jgi:hypothetical protein